MKQHVRQVALELSAAIGRAVPTAPPPATPQRILLIKPDHLGDMLLATPALTRLRQQHPRAFIALLAAPASAALVADHPTLDVILPLTFPGFQRGIPAQHPALLATYTHLWQTAQLLQAGNFDTALLLRDDHWWGAALSLLARIPRRIGHAHPACQPFLTTALPWYPTEHVTQQNLAVVAALTDAPPPAVATPQAAPLSYRPSAADRAWATDWYAAHIAPGQRMLVLHPGTGGNTKLWQPEHWGAVAHELRLRRPDLCLVLTGTAAEDPLVAAIADQLAPPVHRLVGQTTVGQLTALLAHATLVLGVDSGPLHLAVSQGVPTIHLFGPSDSHRFAPWGDPVRHVVVRANLWCSPCGVFAACPRHTDPPECMASITPAAVVQAAHRLLTA